MSSYMLKKSVCVEPGALGRSLPHLETCQGIYCTWQVLSSLPIEHIYRGCNVGFDLWAQRVQHKHILVKLSIVI